MDYEIGVKVTLDEPDSFLLVKESLTRIGVASNKSKTLYQSCHILHKRGEYYVCHFKELFKLDGRPSTLTLEDIQRRNLVVSLLSDWGLVTVTTKDNIKDKANMSSIKVLPYKEKDDWQLVAKYQIGNNKTRLHK